MHHSKDEESECEVLHDSFKLPEPDRPDIIVYPHGPLGPLTPETFSVGILKTLEQTPSPPTHTPDKSNA